MVKKVVGLFCQFWLMSLLIINYDLQGDEVRTNTASKTIKTATYGTWDSPITAQKIAEGSTIIVGLVIDGEDTYWNEVRPANKGRSTIVRRDTSGSLHDITPPDFNARTLVHEYGGLPFTVANGVVYTSNGIDSAIYAIDPNQSPRRITEGQVSVDHQGKMVWQGTRFADMQVISKGLVAVGEHHQPGKDVENFLAFIDLKTGKYRKIASGHDFYAAPALSKDQKKIAWIAWNHPNMPWTSSELWIADIDQEGNLTNQKQIGGTIKEAILQPQWSPDGTLYFISDRDKGWWNIHSYVNGVVTNIGPIEAEVGEPLWLFGKSTYAFLGDSILFAYNKLGQWYLGLLDPKGKQWQEIKRQATYIHQVKAGKGFARFLESYADKEEALVQINNTPGHPSQDLYTTDLTIPAGYISKPQHIVFPSNGRTAYGLYYPPCNPDFEGLPGEKPPLVVMIHGGPTAQAKNVFALKQQFWTSRGFAVLDVNYGGSTGYGRMYRQLLDRSWGIVDVEDCVNGAKFLADRGLVDKDKLVIRGGSAGGFTTLAALELSSIFRAGASYYGVADITALAQDTHKFESRYMDVLVGKYPEEKALWVERSPINSIEKIKSPLIIFQGEDDPIVPKNQSIMVYEALKKRHIPVELHIYPGEGHGFRQAASLSDSLQREAAFYLGVFGKD